ncbi:MAG: GtrA family protein [Candidatus Izemoplasmatales bacterium]
MEQQKKQEIVRSLKYVMFAASAGLIQIGSFAILTEWTGLPYWPRYLIALALSIVWNFTFNRRFTFKSATDVGPAMVKAFAFYVFFTPASTILGEYLVGDLFWNDYLVTGINMLLNFVLEFLYQRFYVFRDSIDSNDLAMKARTKAEQKHE